jgi:hypothetical protein
VTREQLVHLVNEFTGAKGLLEKGVRSGEQFVKDGGIGGARHHEDAK